MTQDDAITEAPRVPGAALLQVRESHRSVANGGLLHGDEPWRYAERLAAAVDDTLRGGSRKACPRS